MLLLLDDWRDCWSKAALRGAHVPGQDLLLLLLLLLLRCRWPQRRRLLRDDQLAAADGGPGRSGRRGAPGPPLKEGAGGVEASALIGRGAVCYSGCPTERLLVLQVVAPPHAAR